MASDDIYNTDDPTTLKPQRPGARPVLTAAGGAAPAPQGQANDPFASIGGGVQLAGGEWVPKGHPLAAQAGAGATSPQAPGAGPVQGAATTVGQQAQNASTYSATPGAAPTEATANQGAQDVVRNSWLAQATQGTTVDPNDPNIKAQVDPFAAQQERSRRQYESEAAERLSAQGLGNSGQMDQERRFASERAGQATGMFKSQLVTRELENKRNEIKEALAHLGDTISGDQKMKLQRDLADLDAAVKREGIASGASVAGNELNVKDKLGTGALNIDLMRALLQNQQFGDSQALDWSKFDWATNPMNPQNF